MPDIRSLLRPLGISASGLSAQRLRMDVIAQNIANAQTTRTAEGGPYRRQMVELAPQGAMSPAAFGEHLRRELLQRTQPGHFPEGIVLDTLAERPGGVQVLGITEDPSEGARVYDPDHPDADDEGYVLMPNVDLTVEMVDLMMARRLYDANATAFEAAKHMLRTSLDL